MKTKIPLLLLLSSFFSLYGQQNIFISPSGSLTANGEYNTPVSSLDAALQIAAQSGENEINIYFFGGTYEFSKPSVIRSGEFEGKTLFISAVDGAKVILTGSKTITPVWEKENKNIYKTAVDEIFDQLYINDEKRILARYPNYTENVLFNGTAADALSPARIKKWKDPSGGYIHSMHRGRWGSQHYLITGKEKDRLLYEGGYQVIRDSEIHSEMRYVENIREELDSPGEWFLDRKGRTLYYYPYPYEELESASVEVVTTPHILELRGESSENCLKNVRLENLCFSRTLRTFMHPYDSLMRSDWGIYRGAALFLENTEDCHVTSCEFFDLGGNAIFLSRYNFDTSVSSNHIHHIGASGISLVGDIFSLRSPSFGYNDFIPYDEMDLTPGPKNSMYPRQCIVEDNLIHDIGMWEKQVAGVQIQVAAGILVRNNSIYRCPRAGINIGDGAFGGHVLEYNDVFETVLETSDHGAFNSWGRDRFWHPDFRTMDSLTREHREIILLDAIYTTIIRNNRFRCDHGWDIDLDDGSSNYHIYNNLCLRGGIKLREGFFRKVEANLVVNNSLHPHVWFPNSGDVVQRNVFMQPYFPIQMEYWGENIDYNFFSSPMSLEKAYLNGTDKHSMTGKMAFVSPETGDFRLREDSDAFLVGFENIPMNRFGVRTPELKARAENPGFPEIQLIDRNNGSKEYEWLGAKIRLVSGMGDQSAFGLPDQRGVIITDVREGSLAESSGFRRNDVIRAVNGNEISSIEEIYSYSEENRWLGSMNLKIFRNQKEEEKRISLK